MTRINAMLERRKDDSGFTLIGILIAIAIPTFLGARQRAQDRAAQSALRNSVTAAKTLYTDKEDYTTANSTNLQTSEPSISFVDHNVDSDKTKAPNSVSAYGKDTQHWFGAAFSASGTCWYVEEDVSTDALAGTHWAKRAGAAAGECNGDYVAAHNPAATATDPGTATAI